MAELPEYRPALPKVVRLEVQHNGTWFSVTCSVCHKVIAQGEPECLGLTLEAVLVRAAIKHLHAG